MAGKTPNLLTLERTQLSDSSIFARGPFFYKTDKRKNDVSYVYIITEF
jgi:hypothetical protein